MKLVQWHFVALGLLSTISVLWLYDNLVPTRQTGLLLSYTLSFIRFVVAFAVGGLIARRAFTIPAVISAALWTSVIILHTAFLAAQHALPVIPVLVNNLPLLIIIITAAFFGAKLGVRLRSKISSRPEVAS